MVLKLRSFQIYEHVDDATEVDVALQVSMPRAMAGALGELSFAAVAAAFFGEDSLAGTEFEEPRKPSQATTLVYDGPAQASPSVPSVLGGVPESPVLREAMTSAPKRRGRPPKVKEAAPMSTPDPTAAALGVASSMPEVLSTAHPRRRSVAADGSVTPVAPAPKSPAAVLPPARDDDLTDADVSKAASAAAEKASPAKVTEILHQFGVGNTGALDQAQRKEFVALVVAL